MVWYLYSATGDTVLTEDDRISLLMTTITTDLFDVALYLLKKYPLLAIARDENGETALHALARKPSAFASGCHFGVWQSFIYSCEHVEFSNITRDKKDQHVAPVQSLNRWLWKTLKSIVPNVMLVHDTKVMNIQALEMVKFIWNEILSLKGWEISSILREPSRPLFTAAELGIIEYIIVLIQSYPDLIWKVDNEHRSIFHTAVAYRQEKIFNLIYDIGALKDLITSYVDSNNNNMLHLAAKLAPSSRLNTISGAALQMQREYQWFKEVEKIVQPLYTEMKNSDGRTPAMMFREEHANLVKEGEKWMKDTASSCMVVATLIATVVFAAAFTVPGGDNNNNGIPIFIKAKSFMVFAISDALALFSSATSVLMFLSILTSRYAEEDFAKSLPKRMIIGLATLFVSIATMMIAFSATLSIVLDSRMAWVAIPISVFALVPVTLFALLQFPLFIDMIRSTYGFGVFKRLTKPMLY
ncbi:ankyrin repeat-containing protein ITN1-like isoform X2 [Telopea speciosissima]|nr:ankyrin repeat-containing protein ITN1-like isoform X2 [Telopea speciosissima]